MDQHVIDEADECQMKAYILNTEAYCDIVNLWIAILTRFAHTVRFRNLF